MKNLFIFIFCLSFAGLSYAGDFNAFTGEINAEKINLRVDATTGSQVICVLAKGKVVEVVGQGYDWYKVRLPANAPSYIRKDLVECIDKSTEQSPPGQCQSAKIIKDKVNIRLGPNESSWIVGKAEKSTIVNILGQRSSWYRIQPVYNSYGWVNKKFVQKAEAKKEEPGVPLVLTKPEPSQAQLVIEGMVNPYGMVLWRTATHKLITADNKIYLLKGNRQNLNALNYHKVKITGKLISHAKSKYPIVEVAVIEGLN